MMVKVMCVIQTMIMIFFLDSDDCGVLDSSTYLGVEEICDGKDNDCDEIVDEGFVNMDKDGFVNCVDLDDDNDGLLDVEDNCIIKVNFEQVDNDFDGVGDECDEDDDGDGVFDLGDNCLMKVNGSQSDQDSDGKGDECDDDDDGDNVFDVDDNCSFEKNFS